MHCLLYYIHADKAKSMVHKKERNSGSQSRKSHRERRSRPTESEIGVRASTNTSLKPTAANLAQVGCKPETPAEISNHSKNNRKAGAPRLKSERLVCNSAAVGSQGADDKFFLRSIQPVNVDNAIKVPRSPAKPASRGLDDSVSPLRSDDRSVENATEGCCPNVPNPTLSAAKMTDSSRISKTREHRKYVPLFTASGNAKTQSARNVHGKLCQICGHQTNYFMHHIQDWV